MLCSTSFKPVTTCCAVSPCTIRMACGRSAKVEAPKRQRRPARKAATQGANPASKDFAGIRQRIRIGGLLRHPARFSSLATGELAELSGVSLRPDTRWRSQAIAFALRPNTVSRPMAMTPSRPIPRDGYNAAPHRRRQKWKTDKLPRGTTTAPGKQNGAARDRRPSPAPAAIRASQFDLGIFARWPADIWPS